MATISSAKTFDGVAIGLSGLCLVHCLALPLLAVILPIAGTLAEAEWIHWLFVGFAVPVSTLALFGRACAPSGYVIAMVLVGLWLLIAGAAGWPDHAWETIITVAGGLVLAAAHAVNSWRARHSPDDRSSGNRD